MASLKQTALAAIMWTRGPPCMPGNVSRSISFAYAARHSTMPAREMGAVREVQAQRGVAGFQRGHVDGDVRGRARMRLHVGVLRAEEFLGAIEGELLDFVRVFAAAVIALAGIAFCVFVGEDRA